LGAHRSPDLIASDWRWFAQFALLFRYPSL
jgi:hypothetical protein